MIDGCKIGLRQVKITDSGRRDIKVMRGGESE